MRELKHSVLHYIATATGARFDRACMQELESDFDAAETRIALLEAVVEKLITDLTVSLSTLQAEVQEVKADVSGVLVEALMPPTRRRRKDVH